MPLTPEVLTAQGEVVAWLGSLDVSFALDEEPWFTIDGVENPRQIGSDGSGGAFVLLPSQNVLYVSSEGRAGMIAESFEAFIQLAVARPYWLDILKFSAGGDLQEMRRAADALEATLDDEDDVNEAREEIRAQLGLPGTDDPVGALYQAVATSDAIVRAPTAARSRRCSIASASTTARRCATLRRERKSYFAHSPLRNTGTLLPSARMPSISVSAEPIIQSIWIRLWLPPCAAICCGVSCAPLMKHFE